MTADQKLAVAWNKAWDEYADGGSEEPLVLADNAIAYRLDIPLDETEQGLTTDAVIRIQRFVLANTPAKVC